MRRDAERVVDGYADPPQYCDQPVMCTKPCAASGKVVRTAFEHIDAPPGRPQHVSREQPAERTADDQGVAAHVVLMRFSEPPP
jgi:hypothetical protein